MRELGHAEIDLLKLDVGGAEREVLRGALDDGVDIGVICVDSDSRRGLSETASLLRDELGFQAVAVAGAAATFVSDAATGLPF